MKWTMRDGRKISLKEMESSHIRNCVAMLRRGTNRDIMRLLDVSRFVGMLRGEHAVDCAEQELDRLGEEMIERAHQRECWIQAFNRELQGRGEPLGDSDQQDQGPRREAGRVRPH